MADVFLSYKREDQQIAREVAADLEAEGFSVFFDVRIGVGESWDATIERELNDARAVVVLWSPRSRESQWVRREAREAIERRILCPAMIARCKVPLEFSDVQAADLIGRRAGDRAHGEWRRLCDGVGRCVGRKARGIAPPPTPPPPPIRPAATPAPAPIQQPAAAPADRESPNRRALILAGAAAGAALVAGGGYYGWTRAQAGNAWAEARAAGTRRAVHAFLRAHPNAPQAQVARATLASLPLSVREIAALRGHEDTVWSAAFSPDGARIVTAGDSTARVWDAASGREIALLRGHEDTVQSAAFSPDGARIVTASGDGTARVWEIDEEA